MDRLLSVSRAAKLAGVSRKALQLKIHDGDLASFEGKLRLQDIITAFPQTQIEDTAMVEKIADIVDSALKRAHGAKLQKLLAPDLGTLASRVYLLSKELALSRGEQTRLQNIVHESLSRLENIHAATESMPAIHALQDWLTHAIDTPVSENINQHASLLATDTILRLVTAQVHIMPSGHEFLIEGRHSILEAGLNAGLSLNYGCNNGECGNCKARLISGEVRTTRKQNYVFSEKETQQRYILACCNTAVTDVVLLAQEAIDDTDIPVQEINAQIYKLEILDEQLAILNLRTPLPSRLRFLSGQSIYLSCSETGESLQPVASCPCDDRNLEFHIPRAENDFSKHVFQGLTQGDTVHLRGPKGTFLLRRTLVVRPLLFLAFEVGFAPIKALIEQAITLDEVDRIHLYRFSHGNAKPYLDNVCRSWKDNIDIFRYTRLPLTDNMFAPLANDYLDLQAFDIYLAGDNQMLEQANLFLDTQGHSATQRFSFNADGDIEQG